MKTGACMKYMTVKLSNQSAPLLSALDAPLQQVVEELVDHSVFGVWVRESWQRSWLCQLFGYGWLERLGPDPRGLGQERPRRR